MSGFLGVLVAGGGLGNPQLTDRSVSSSGAGVQNVSLTFFSSGGLSTGINGNLTSRAPEWSGLADPVSTVGNFYQLRLSVTSGTAPTGSSFDTWLDLSSSPSYNLTTSGVGAVTGTWLVEIRHKTTQIVEASATFTMTATRTS